MSSSSGRFIPWPAHGPGLEATRLLQQGQGALRFRKTRELLRLQKAADYDRVPPPGRRAETPASRLGGQLRRAGKSRLAQLRRPAAPVLNSSEGFLRPRSDEGRPALIGQTGAERPLSPRRALYYHYPRPLPLLDEERDAAAALFPLSPAEAEAHDGPGEKGFPCRSGASRCPRRQGPCPGSGPRAARGRSYTTSPRDAVRRKTAEVSVGQRRVQARRAGRAARRTRRSRPRASGGQHGAAAPRPGRGGRGPPGGWARELGPARSTTSAARPGCPPPGAPAV